MTPHPSDNLRAIERTLYVQLGALALVAAGVGLVAGAWAWGISAAAGFVAAIIYYFLLGLQVRRQLARGKQPNVMSIVVSLLGRQVICFAVPFLCYFYLGDPWWACLATLLVARHWVMLIGLRGVPGTPAPSQA